jgi:hypothetical protein
MPLLSANIIVCENVLTENPDIGGPVPSAIRTISVIALPPGNNSAHFFALTFLSSQPGDFSPHTVQIQVTGKSGTFIAQAPPLTFRYGYLIDPSGPGGYILRTEFNVDVSAYNLPLGCLVSAFLDGSAVARTPLMLLRRG